MFCSLSSSVELSRGTEFDPSRVMGLGCHAISSASFNIAGVIWDFNRVVSSEGSFYSSSSDTSEDSTVRS